MRFGVGFPATDDALGEEEGAFVSGFEIDGEEVGAWGWLFGWSCWGGGCRHGLLGSKEEGVGEKILFLFLARPRFNSVWGYCRGCFLILLHSKGTD